VASRRPPQGTTTRQPQGQSHTMHAPVPSRAAPGAAAWSGCARPTGCHTSPSVQDHLSAVSLGAWPRKHLTQNQMFCSRADCRHRPRPKSLPDLHQFVHQRLRTTMDIPGPNPKIRPDHGPMCTSQRVLLPTTDQKARGSSPFVRVIADQPTTLNGRNSGSTMGPRGCF
jgi:hypothetical protein